MKKGLVLIVIFIFTIMAIVALNDEGGAAGNSDAPLVNAPDVSRDDNQKRDRAVAQKTVTFLKPTMNKVTSTPVMSVESEQGNGTLEYSVIYNIDNIDDIGGYIDEGALAPEDETVQVLDMAPIGIDDDNVIAPEAGSDYMPFDAIGPQGESEHNDGHGPEENEPG
jgi:hypothetical protein